MKQFLIRITAIPVFVIALTLFVPVWLLTGISIIDHLFDWYDEHLN